MTKLCQWRDHQGTQSLPLEDFPRNKQRKDGIHAYCRVCCRNIVYAQRAVLREMKAKRELAQRLGLRPEVKWKSPEFRVLKAIQSGARTQPEIVKQARLPFDELGLVLVKLIVDQKRVITRVSGDTREYFVRSEAA
jgi:hypothetical protein